MYTGYVLLRRCHIIYRCSVGIRPILMDSCALINRLKKKLTRQFNCKERITASARKAMCKVSMYRSPGFTSINITVSQSNAMTSNLSFRLLCRLYFTTTITTINLYVYVSSCFYIHFSPVRLCTFYYNVYVNCNKCIGL